MKDFLNFSLAMLAGCMILPPLLLILAVSPVVGLIYLPFWLFNHHQRRWAHVLALREMGYEASYFDRLHYR